MAKKENKKKASKKTKEKDDYGAESIKVLNCVKVIFFVKLLSLASEMAIESNKLPTLLSAANP